MWQFPSTLLHCQYWWCVTRWIVFVTVLNWTCPQGHNQLHREKQRGQNHQLLSWIQIRTRRVYLKNDSIPWQLWVFSTVWTCYHAYVISSSTCRMNDFCLLRSHCIGNTEETRKLSDFCPTKKPLYTKVILVRFFLFVCRDLHWLSALDDRLWVDVHEPYTEACSPLYCILRW